MSEQQGEMSFWDHLEELRWTLFRCVIALVVFTVGGFVFLYYCWDSVVFAPLFPDFILYRLLCKITMSVPFVPDFCDLKEIKIFNVDLTSPFFTHMSTSFWLALLMTFPYLVYEIWKFIRPALYPHEKKSVRWVFSFGTVMFFIGCAIGYFLVFPLSLQFLATYRISAVLDEQTSLESYLNSFLLLVFVMGAMFELPLLSWFLSKVGLLKRSFFKKYRRYAVVGLLIAAALITPSGDPFTLSVVFFPLYGLYELSAFLVKKEPKEKDESSDIVKHGTG